MYSRISWRLLCGRAWAAVGVLLSLAVPTTPTCPRDPASQAAKCFDLYSDNKRSLETIPQHLCCGLDVEPLRRFCQSYTVAISCHSRLRASCPTHLHDVINKELRMRIPGSSVAVLDELCGDDRNIERYAMYQNCFRTKGHQTQSCFRDHMKHTLAVPRSGVTFLTQVSFVKKADFCRDMRRVVSCVADTYSQCGRGAVTMAAVLVKPMVQESGDCDYTQAGHQQTTLSSHHNNPAYISDGDRQTDAHTHNHSRCLSSLSADVIVMAALSSLWIHLLRGS